MLVKRASVGMPGEDVLVKMVGEDDLPVKMAKRPQLRWITVCLVLLAALAMGACGGDSEEGSAGGGSAATSGGETAAPGKDVKVGLALAGPSNDDGFYETNLDAVNAAKEKLGFKLSVVDTLEETQAQIDALRNLAQAGNNVVIAGGAAFTQGVETVADQFPDTQFVLSGGVTPTAHDNVNSLAYDWGVPAYVAGRAMAEITKAKTIGVIGGLEAPPTTQSVAAIKAAAKDSGANIKVLETTVGTFSDPAKAKSATAAMVADGADYIYAFLDAGLVGSEQAIEESGKDVKFFGPVRLRCDELGEQYAGGTTLKIDNIIGDTLSNYVNKTLKPGIKYVGLEGQSFEFCPEVGNAKAKEVAAEVSKAIEDGSLELPASVRNVRPDYYQGE